MEVRTVLLDAGNTLIELDYRVLAELFLAEGVVVSPGQIREAAIRVRPEVDRFLATGRGSSEADDTRKLYLSLVLDHLKAGGPESRERLAKRLAKALADLWYVPAEGAAETLELLRLRGLGLGVVSNSDGRIAQLFAENGLLPLVDTVVDSGAEGVEKPDPAIFRIALERLGAKAESAVHVGDLPAIDVAGARAAGVTPILLDPYEVFPDPGVARIRSLPELPPLLETL